MKDTAKKASARIFAFSRFFLYALCGSLLALPSLIPSLWPLGWVAAVPVLCCELFSQRLSGSYLAAYGRGMSFFWFFGLLTFYWFWQLYPLDFLGFDKTSALFVVLLATLGIPLLQGLSSSLVFVFIAFAKKRGLFSKAPLLGSAFVAALFSLAEYLHTLTWAGVPWGRLAIGQTGCAAAIQSASLFGSYFITFLIIFCSSLLAFSLCQLKRRTAKKDILSLSLALLIFFSNLGYGAFRISAIEGELSPDTTVACLQGNIRFEDKWAGKGQYTLDLYRSMTKEASAKGADIVFWPETALPYDISDDDYLYGRILSLAKEADCHLIATAFARDSEGRLYNTARYISPEGEQVGPIYSKRHLVPFGEYIPYENLIRKYAPPLAELSAIDDPVTPGESSAVFDTPKGRIGSLICFDSIYETLSRDSVLDGAELLAIYTNDSWFTGSAALAQHNGQAILRAVECRRYVVRAANTGISSVISPTGKVLSSLGDSETGFVLEEVDFIKENTLYTTIGNSFLTICAIGVALTEAALFINHLRKRKKLK